MTTSTSADVHIGMSNTCRMSTPPANNVSASHEMMTVTMVYHARMLRVLCPKRRPMNSGSVEMLAPK